MKLFITGVCGQLGSDVLKEAIKRGYDCIGCDISESCAEEPDASVASFSYVRADIRDKSETEKIILDAKPDGIIHCAAWTAVDKAEEKENFGKVMTLNVRGTEYIARAARLAGAKMMYISTDYVFNGSGTRPRKPDDKMAEPLNVYGKSKLWGEKVVKEMLKDFFIVRTAWVFGKNGNNFVRTMLNLGDKYDEIRVVNDQIGTPTYTPDLARLLVDMIETDKFGIYHATNSEARDGEYISWYDFACEIFRQSGKNVTVIPVSTEEYGKSLAERPHNSRLDKSKLIKKGFKPLPPWTDALGRYLEETGKLNNMFRDIVRKKQALSTQECIDILVREKRGTLAVAGDDGYPYCMPMNHYYCPEDGKIYFHSGKTGHKIDSLLRCSKVSFCVCNEGERLENSWILMFKSVIVFGTVEIIEDREIINDISRKLSLKFTSDEAYIQREIDKHGPSTLMFAIVPEHITGKTVKES